ncbi:MAG: hypothetical protein F4Y27_05430 [Acidimicrobiaceae bacterium]|nr:hypothetical protein [Acidimicrobiaceae bacterium]MXW60771.1 hypothetical protein [Acidimicrobiaceae bacterium]MYA74096.1 hypothetical protein [Acidimicrobiaceae bacterium]MYC42391.1 hypothetical protein [Acidimicrobiaceae bacterium]MYG55305.1 hypothetical protein [Acidimicrobiaceae bacterium]
MPESNPQIERRLRRVSQQLRLLRADLQVTDEQLNQLRDEAYDARVRALVSETPLAEREHRRVSRHVERLSRHRDRVVGRIAELDATQDMLLDRLSAP